MADAASMLILGIDTSGAAGSLALCRGTSDRFDVLGYATLGAQTFSAQLAPEILALLQNNHLAVEDIDGYAVVTGPGSFTGLRVGLAAIKGLCEVLPRSIASVGMLHAMALCEAAAGTQSRRHAVLDAGRGGFFVNTYESGGLLTHGDGKLVGRDELMEITGSDSVIICEPQIEEVFKGSGKLVQMIARPDSREIARIGMQKIERGEIVSAEDLTANYLREADVKVSPRETQPAALAVQAAPAKWKR